MSVVISLIFYTETYNLQREVTDSYLCVKLIKKHHISSVKWIPISND